MKTIEKEQNLSQEEIERIKIQQARILLPFLNTDAWKLIVNIFNAKKRKVELERRKANKLQSTRDLIFYYNGMVDGVEEMIESVEGVISEAEEIENKNKMLSDIEGLED